MTTAEKINQDAWALPSETRVEPAKRLVASLVDDVPEEIQRAHIDEVGKRIVQVESGEVEMLSGDEALASVRSACAIKEAPTIAQRFNAGFKD